jgi:hypothetical protein
MSDLINLEKFYSSDPTRENVARPFSFDGWTYATNGHVVVRVPKRDDIAENPAAPNDHAAALFDKCAKKRRYKPAPSFELSEPFEWEEQIECICCASSGRRHHDCPTCKCECKICSGRGKIAIRRFGTVAIGTAYYSSKYISWLQSLPKLELGPPHKKNPLPFRFGGGEGLLMPVECRKSDSLKRR